MMKSELDQIKGIGTKTKEILIKEIGSPEKIRKTPEPVLTNLIGKQKTQLLLEYFKK